MEVALELNLPMLKSIHLKNVPLIADFGRSKIAESQTLGPIFSSKKNMFLRYLGMLLISKVFLFFLD